MNPETSRTPQDAARPATVLGPACALPPGASRPRASHAAQRLLPPPGASPPGVDDLTFLQAADDEVKVRLTVRPDGTLAILALAPNTRLVEELLDGVPRDQVRTELCG